MKKLALLLVVLLFAGCVTKVVSPVPTQRPRIDAEFSITRWKPEKIKWGERKGNWGVGGWYEIKNAGNVKIGYFVCLIL